MSIRHDCVACVRFHGAIWNTTLIAAACGALVAATLTNPGGVLAANRTWIGGNAAWDTSSAKWNPADEPDADDTAIFNTANTVTMTIDNEVLGLTMSGGTNLATAQQQLTVIGPVSLTGSGTVLQLHTNNLLSPFPPLPVLDAGDITIGNGATLRMANNVAALNSGGDQVTIAQGGTLFGNGYLALFYIPTVAGIGLDNNGTITAGSFGNAFVTAETLSIGSVGITTVDLDGSAETGMINVLREQTFINLSVPHDSFDGIVNLKQNSTFDHRQDWVLASGTITIDNGFEPELPPFIPAVAAGVAYLKGNTITMSSSGSLIEVVDSDGTLVFDAPLIANDGVINNRGLIVFNDTATIGSSVDMLTSSDTDYEFNAVVTVSDTNWDWDNNGGTNNDITINVGGQLTANITAAAASVFSGDLHIVGGILNVQGDNNDWHQTGGLISFEGPALGLLSGDRFVQTGGAFRALAGSNGDVNAATLWDSGNLFIEGELELIGAVEWAGSNVTGSGILEQEGNATVTANTTIAVDVYDWDQSSTTINSGVTFTVDVDNVDRSDDTFNSNTINVNGGTLDVTVADGSWSLGSGGVINLTGAAKIASGSSLVVANGGVINAFGSSATIDTPVTVQTGGVIEIEDAAGYLAITAPTTLAGGDINQIAGGANLTHDGLIVTGDSAINVSTFVWDSGVTVVESGGKLLVNVNSFTPGADTHHGIVTMNSGDIDVQVADGRWTMDGTLNIDSTPGDTAVLSGDAIDIGDGSGTLDARLNVTGMGTSIISAPITFHSDADVNIAAGATLQTGSLLFAEDSIGSEYSGSGTWIMAGNNTFDATLASADEKITINMVGGTVDLDNSSMAVMFANDTSILSPVTINAATLASYGSTKGLNGSSVSEMTIESNLGGLVGSLTVNLDDPTDEWTLRSDGVINLIGNSGVPANHNLIRGADINLDGTVNVTSQVMLSARIDIGGTVNITNFASELRLQGGSLADPNTLTGGTIIGAGDLRLNAGVALVGHGTINTSVAMLSNSQLIAQNGTLTVNGTIDASSQSPVHTIGVDQAGSQLFIPRTWHTNIAQNVTLNGGEIRGATIINDGVNGIRGHGSIFAPVANETRIDADGGTLIVENAFNDIEWDGFIDAGALHADTGSLEIRDDAAYPFHAIASVGAGQELFANGFSLDFQPSSTLNLAAGTYRATADTHLRGALNVAAAGDSTFEGAGQLVFASTSQNALADDLKLENPLTRIESGAEFSGSGGLVNSAGNTLQLLDGADVDVLIENRGTLRLGSSPGQTQGFEYNQTASGSWEVELASTAADQYDRMTLTGIATLDGVLALSLLDGFQPMVNDTFIILAAAAIHGEFSTIDDTAATLGSNLQWEVHYNQTNVQLVVSRAGLPGDYNGNGIVDAADYTVWRDGLGGEFTPADYGVWKQNFGATGATGSASADAVPEPATLPLIVFAAAVGMILGQKTRRVVARGVGSKFIPPGVNRPAGRRV
ncbi:MAG: hypothetical protein WD851_12970 [Pirellulales bacterium]